MRILLCLFLTACFGGQTFGDAELDISDTLRIQKAVGRVLEAGDLNDDGFIRGDSEWISFVNAVTYEVMRLRLESQDG